MPTLQAPQVMLTLHGFSLGWGGVADLFWHLNVGTLIGRVILSLTKCVCVCVSVCGEQGVTVTGKTGSEMRTGGCLNLAFQLKSHQKSVKVNSAFCQVCLQCCRMKWGNVLYELWRAAEMWDIFRSVDLWKRKALRNEVALLFPYFVERGSDSPKVIAKKAEELGPASFLARSSPLSPGTLPFSPAAVAPDTLVGHSNFLCFCSSQCWDIISFMAAWDTSSSTEILPPQTLI